MPAALFLSGPCEICGRNAFGNHYGVLSCRPCASFFRRAAGKPTNCSRGANCEIYSNGKFQCKKCRLRKCYDVGMDPRKFQHDRDLISTGIKKPQSMANYLGRPTFILCCEPDKASPFKTIIDVSFLINKAIRLMDNVPLKPYASSNSLNRICLTFEEMRRRSASKVQFLKRLGKNESIKIWEDSFLSAAEWFCSFPEFNMLDVSVKVSILKTVWILWTRLDKLSETAENRKKEIFGLDVYMLTNDVAMDFNDFEIDISWCTNYSLDQLQYFMYQEVEYSSLKCVDDLMTLSPTDMELNFMLVHLCLYHAGKHYQGEVLEATDRLIQLISDNLHQYYVEQLKMSNYSSRLLKLMRVNRAIEKEFMDRKEKNKIVSIFDILSIEFSHPEMFEGN